MTILPKTLLSLLAIFSLCDSCSPESPQSPSQEKTPDTSLESPQGKDGDEDSGQEKDSTVTTMAKHIILKVGDSTFKATLSDTRAAEEFASLLPMTLHMSELNGNEKYHYLQSPLTRDDHRAGSIRTGDIKLYSGSCVVLFYKDFESGYSYTDLGTVDSPYGLGDALGSGSVDVSFEAE